MALLVYYIFAFRKRIYLISIFVFEEDIFDLRGYIILGEDIFCVRGILYFVTSKNYILKCKHQYLTPLLSYGGKSSVSLFMIRSQIHLCQREFRMLRIG